MADLGPRCRRCKASKKGCDRQQPLCGRCANAGLLPKDCIPEVLSRATETRQTHRQSSTHPTVREGSRKQVADSDDEYSDYKSDTHKDRKTTRSQPYRTKPSRNRTELSTHGQVDHERLQPSTHPPQMEDTLRAGQTPSVPPREKDVPSNWESTYSMQGDIYYVNSVTGAISFQAPDNRSIVDVPGSRRISTPPHPVGSHANANISHIGVDRLVSVHDTSLKRKPSTEHDLCDAHPSSQFKKPRMETPRHPSLSVREAIKYANAIHRAHRAQLMQDFETARKEFQTVDPRVLCNARIQVPGNQNPRNFRASNQPCAIDPRALYDPTIDGLG